MGKVVGSTLKVLGGVPHALISGGSIKSAVARNLQLSLAYASGGTLGFALAAGSMVAQDVAGKARGTSGLTPIDPKAINIGPNASRTICVGSCA